MVDVEDLVRPIVRRLTWTRVILGLGILFRVAQYLADRGLWMDEGSLKTNIVSRPLSELHRPLGGEQIAPLGFLYAEKVVSLLCGTSNYALRLIPLACGVVALFLFLALARRCLSPRAVPVALALFAASDDLIYYSSELKPYICDVAAALACYLAAAVVREGRPSATRVLACGAVGAAAVWFSFPAVFVLAGSAACLVAESAARREWRSAWLRLAVGATWGASFAAANRIATGQLAKGTGLWAFWDFAFPPRPLAPASGLSWAARQFVYLFVNPLNFETPFGPWVPAILALALYLTGCAALWRGRRVWLGMLTSPLPLAMAAAFLHKYPFHGRLILFLVPALHLPIAEGAGWVRARSRSATLYGLILAALLLFPTLYDVLRVFEPRQRAFFNPVGDYRTSHRLP
jgi:hypothetical protein